MLLFGFFGGGEGKGVVQVSVQDFSDTYDFSKSLTGNSDW